MKNYLKHIDDFFREKLGRYRETPPPDVWEALDKQLDGLIPSAPKPSFRWGGHIAMVSLVAVLSIPVVKKILGNKGHQNAGNTELSIAAKAPVQQAVNTTTTEGGKVANGDAISAPLSVNGSTAKCTGYCCG